MMPRPASLKLATLVALVASVSVHLGVAAIDPGQRDEVQVAGGEAAQAAALGSSFENLVRAGDRVSPVESEPAAAAEVQPDEIAPTTTPPQTPPVPGATFTVPPDPATTPQTHAVQPRAADTAARSQQIDLPDASAPAIASQAHNPAIAALVPTQPAAAGPALVPSFKAPAMAAQPPSAAAQEPEIAALRPVSPREVIEAAPDQPLLPIPAARPFRQIDVDRARAREQAEADRRRQAEHERWRQAEQQRQSERQPAKQQPRARRQQSASGAQRGQANRNARQGQAEGRRQGEGATARQGDQRASSAGNAAASNYPGKVYAKIRRTRQRAAGGSGTVRVRFSIAGSGALAGVSVAGSSGSRAVDSAAVNHIQRAAPFPAPPPGAQTRFVIPIEIRR